MAALGTRAPRRARRHDLRRPPSSARRRLPHLVRSAMCSRDAGAVAFSSAALIHAFVSQDHSIKYVQQYSDRTMETFYRVTAFWAAWTARCRSAARPRSTRRSPCSLLTATDRSYVIASPAAISSSSWCSASRPTCSRLTLPTPAGAESAAQNLYMVFHPPALYLGFVGWRSRSRSLAALVTGRLDHEWIVASRKWTLFAWMFLAIGNALGMLWAYEEFGWGGYWAWDPVENAAFMPFLTASAFVHSVMIQEAAHAAVWNSCWSPHVPLTISARSRARASQRASLRSRGSAGIFIFLGIAAVVSFGFCFFGAPFCAAHQLSRSSRASSRSSSTIGCSARRSRCWC